MIFACMVGLLFALVHLAGMNRDRFLAAQLEGEILKEAFAAFITALIIFAPLVLAYWYVRGSTGLWGMW